MKCFNFDELLALVDKDQRKSKDGITVAFLLEDEEYPVFCHFLNMDELLAEILPEMVNRDNIVEVATDCIPYPGDEKWEEWQESEKSLDSVLKELKPSDLDIVTADEKSSLIWMNDMYRFMSNEDAKRVLLAIQKKAYDILQEELIDREETRSGKILLSLDYE